MAEAVTAAAKERPTEPFEMPTCDKCGAPIETGFMVLICPHREQCEFYEHDWDEDTKKLVRAHWTAS